MTSSHLTIFPFRGLRSHTRVRLFHHVHPRSSGTFFGRDTTRFYHRRNKHHRTVNTLQNHPSPFCDRPPRIIQSHAGVFGNSPTDANSLSPAHAGVRWQGSESEGVGGGRECSSLGSEDKNGAEAGEESEQGLQGCQVNNFVACLPGRHEIHSREERFFCVVSGSRWPASLGRKI